MTKHIIAILIAVAVLTAGFLLSSTKTSEDKNIKPTVVVTLPFLADIVHQLAGDELRVVTLVAPGVSEHNFSLSPQQIKDSQNAKLLLSIGVDLDSWVTAELLDSNPTLSSLSVEKNIALRAMNSNEDEHGDFDPHYWLSFTNAPIIINNVADALISHYPELDKEGVKVLASEYGKRFTDVYSQYNETKGTQAKNKEIITFHDAWQYFATDLGYTISGTVQPFAGKEPSAQYITELLRTIQKNNIKILFVEPQLATSASTFLLQDTGVEIRALDPIGGVEGRMTYYEMMVGNMNEIVR
jgi:zinc transport system substrate-binding protein